MLFHKCRYRTLPFVPRAAFAILAVAAIGSVAPVYANQIPPPSIPASIPAPDIQYDRLLEALNHYTKIETDGGWDAIPTGPVLEVGISGGRVDMLRRRLTIEGDLPLSDGTGAFFDAALATAVRRAQRRYGLDVDGRVGLQTLTALNVPVHDRVVQIAANLERWRQMPLTNPKRRLEVNIPAAELVIFEDNLPTITMQVVVGSPRFPTPLIRSQIVSVVFNPTWTIPSRIARNEILPKLRREPTYLRDNDIRILERSDDPYGEQIDWRQSKRLPVVQLQQQPGPKNALGRIKFDIPNQFSVYLHDTPITSAFKQVNRALSHGCVRLQFPEDVARYVLRDRLLVDPDLIERSLKTNQTTVFNVKNPLPVIFVYWTAFITEDGQLHFRNDIYGHDKLEGEQPTLDGQLGENEYEPGSIGCPAG